MWILNVLSGTNLSSNYWKQLWNTPWLDAGWHVVMFSSDIFIPDCAYVISWLQRVVSRLLSVLITQCQFNPGASWVSIEVIWVCSLALSVTSKEPANDCGKTWLLQTGLKTQIIISESKAFNLGAGEQILKANGICSIIYYFYLFVECIHECCIFRPTWDLIIWPYA